MSCCKDAKKTCSKTAGDQTDYLVCTCMGVMYSEICAEIDQGSTTFNDLSDKLGVGTGCSSCVAEVEAILEQKTKTGCCKS